ncbi:hypothetical protein PR202_ga30308 [Eleusine coracana subsp. coracana]|uniref:Uncharacterized protein n=1 Tax=Eleusine coracana subsp. coracana TaxID=191504 RepID=A0AAV5DNX8_ELECO|nr:hypothetical protein PR202_ga30308 [Eleusine coracana subsp. coracana]
MHCNLAKESSIISWLQHALVVYFGQFGTDDDLNLLISMQLELEYCCVSSGNRKNGKKMQRVWVHGKFKRPMS